MDTLRKPFLFIAIALITLVVLVELGAANVLSQTSTIQASLEITPPGYGIPYLALIDGLVLFTTLLFCTPLLITHRIQGRGQGLVTLIVSILLMLMAIKLILAALTNLVLMVTLLISPIFGTIAYFAIYSNFDTSGASLILSLSMMLKLAFAGCLLIAQQRFLQNTGLVLIILTSLLSTLIISLLHTLVPDFLVSITDAIGGVIVAVLALVWLVFLLIGSLISIAKAII